MRILIVGPHPDDEVLGPGASLLRWQSEGHELSWCLLTQSDQEANSPAAIGRIRQEHQVQRICNVLGITPDRFHWIGLPTAKLDLTPKAELVRTLSRVFNDTKAQILLVPFFGDVHSGHRITAEAAMAASKWFRQPTIEKVLAYETLSESHFTGSGNQQFIPNLYVDVSPWLEEKLKLLGVYDD